MTVFNSVNYTSSRVDEPASKINVKEQHGKLRRLYDSYLLAAEITTADTIVAGVLPKGAKIVNARFVAPTDGTTGQYELGWQANGVDAADADGLFAAAEIDTGGGAIDSKMLGTANGWNKEMGAETTLEISVAENTTASDGDLLEWEVIYVIE